MTRVVGAGIQTTLTCSAGGSRSGRREGGSWDPPSPASWPSSSATSSTATGFGSKPAILTRDSPEVGYSVSFGRLLFNCFNCLTVFTGAENVYRVFSYRSTAVVYAALNGVRFPFSNSRGISKYK